MAKRWTKQKAAHQTAKRRSRPSGSGGSSYAGGAMSGMRRGLQWLVGGGARAKQAGKKETTLDKLINWGLWAAVVVAAYFFFKRQCA